MCNKEAPQSKDNLCWFESSRSARIIFRMNVKSLDAPILDYTYHKEVLHGQQLIERAAELDRDGIKILRMVSPENGVYHVEYRRPVKAERQSELVI